MCRRIAIPLLSGDEDDLLLLMLSIIFLVALSINESSAGATLKEEDDNWNMSAMYNAILCWSNSPLNNVINLQLNDLLSNFYNDSDNSKWCGHTLSPEFSVFTRWQWWWLFL